MYRNSTVKCTEVVLSKIMYQSSHRMYSRPSSPITYLSAQFSSITIPYAICEIMQYIISKFTHKINLQHDIIIDNAQHCITASCTYLHLNCLSSWNIRIFSMAYTVVMNGCLFFLKWYFTFLRVHNPYWQEISCFLFAHAILLLFIVTDRKNKHKFFYSIFAPVYSAVRQDDWQP